MNDDGHDEELPGTDEPTGADGLRPTTPTRRACLRAAILAGLTLGTAGVVRPYRSPPTTVTG